MVKKNRSESGQGLVFIVLALAFVILLVLVVGWIGKSVDDQFPGATGFLGISAGVWVEIAIYVAFAAVVLIIGHTAFAPIMVGIMQVLGVLAPGILLAMVGASSGFAWWAVVLIFIVVTLVVLGLGAVTGGGFFGVLWTIEFAILAIGVVLVILGFCLAVASL